MAEESAITPIETVQDWLDHIEPLRLTMKLHEHARLWFRGHSDHKWKLHPGVTGTTSRRRAEPKKSDFLSSVT